MKALKTKVILSGIVLVFAFIATIGTTFAWFTVSQTATVEEMTLNVTSADSLLILPVDNTGTNTYAATGNGNAGAEIDLLTGTNYMTTLNDTDLVDAGYEVGSASANPWRVSPSSIINVGYGDYSAKSLSIIDSNDFDNRTLVAAQENATDGDYIKLEFYMLLQGETTDTSVIELITTSAINTAAGNTSNQDVISEAVRLSVWFDDTEYYNQLVGSGTGTTGDALVFGNDIDYDYEFIDDFATGRDTLALTDTDINGSGSETLTAITGETAPFDGVLNHYDLGTNSTATNPADIFTLTHGVPTLVTVLIYVEGWDADANDNVSLAEFLITFGFQVGEVGENLA